MRYLCRVDWTRAYTDMKFQLTNAIASEGASPIIRVPWNEEWMIKRALDAGCHGVLTPMCHSAVSEAPAIMNNYVLTCA